MTTFGTISTIFSVQDQPTPFFNLNFLLLSNHELPNSPILHWGGGCFHKMSHTGVLGVVFTLIWNLSCFPGLGTKRVMSLVLQSVWVANMLFQVLPYVVLSDLYPCGHFHAQLGTSLCNWRVGRRDGSFSLAPHKLHLSWEDLGRSGFIPVQGLQPGNPPHRPSGCACPPLRLSRLLLTLLLISGGRKHYHIFQSPWLVLQPPLPHTVTAQNSWSEISPGWAWTLSFCLGEDSNCWGVCVCM